MKFINRITLFLAKSRISWLPFMFALTLGQVAYFLIVAAVSTALHLYREWQYEWRYEWAQWFSYFTDRHRRRLHTLARGHDAGLVCETQPNPPLVHLPSLAAGEHQPQTLQ